MKGSGQNHVKRHAKAQSLVWSWDTARARRVFHTALRGRLAEHHVRLEEKQRGNSPTATFNSLLNVFVLENAATAWSWLNEGSLRWS